MTPSKQPTNRPETSSILNPFQGRGLIEGLRAAGNFTKFLLLLDEAGLTETLSDQTQTFTMFVPDDKAFASLPGGTLDGLLSDPERARQEILPYMLSGKFTAKDLVSPGPPDKLKTLAGSSLQISKWGDGTRSRSPQWGGLLIIFDPATHKRDLSNKWPCCARIVSANHAASNGIYHSITFVSASGGVWR